MPDRSAVPAETTYTTIGSYGLAIARALDARGIDGAALLRTAGIAAPLSNDPLVRVSTAEMTRLYGLCVAATGDPYFGLAVAPHLQLANLHALGYALQASATLFDFCQRFARFIRLVAQVAEATVLEQGQHVALRFVPRARTCSESEDCFLAFVVQTMRQLSHPGVHPLRVEMRRPLPAQGAAPYAALYQAPLVFGQEAGLLVFDRAALLAPLHGASPELALLHDNIVIEYLARLDNNDVVARVTSKIIELLPDGECNRDKVAAALGMSPETQHHKLAQRGTHFQELLNKTRQELACSYLRQARRSVTEVTFLLGFGDTANFSRAFKGWTGMSPSQYRQQG